MTKARRGIYAAAVTPFDQNGRVQQEKLVDYCKHLLSDGGCDGVAPIGTTGEGTSTAMVDRLVLPATFAEAGIEADRVIFGTGAPSLPDCVTLTSAACASGYVNALILPPYYYKNASDDGLFAFYASVIEQVGRDDLRIFLYHFPQMSMVPFSTDLVLRLKAEFGPIIAGLKDSSGDFEQSRGFIEATGGVAEDFDVYPSSEAFLWDGLSIGSAGIISGSTNLTARAVQVAKSAPEGPARDAAMDIVRTARATVSKYPLMASMKTAESWRSGDETWLTMQPPLRPMPEEQKAAFKKDLDAITAI